MVRENTNKLLEMVEEGILDKDAVISAFCSYMSEDDVKDLMECNEWLEEEEEDEEDEEEENLDNMFLDNMFIDATPTGEEASLIAEKQHEEGEK